MTIFYRRKQMKKAILSILLSMGMATTSFAADFSGQYNCHLVDHREVLSQKCEQGSKIAAITKDIGGKRC